jgi:predicted PurR-regulated permease PerM
MPVPGIERSLPAMPSSVSTRFVSRVTAACAVVLAFAAVAAVVVLASDVFLLLFAGILVAVMLRGMAARITRHTRLSVNGALGCVGAALLLLVVLLVVVIGPQLASQVDALANTLPEAIATLKVEVARVPVLDRLLDALPPATTLLTSRGDVLGKITGFFSTTFGALANALIVIAVGAYLAVDPQRYVRGVAHLFPRHLRPRVPDVMHVLASTLGWWLASKAVSMAVIGLLSGIGLWLLGIPMPATLGLLTALLTFIPNIGPILSVIPAALLALLSGPMSVVYVLLLYAGVQLVETYLITPKVQEDMVSLPPAVTLVAQLLAGVLAGGLGLVLAAPLAAGALQLGRMLLVDEDGGVRESGTRPASVRSGDSGATARRDAAPAIASTAAPRADA